MDTDKNGARNMFCSPRPAQAGRGTGRGDLSFTRHLTPALSPNFVGGEGENAVAHFGVQSVFIRVHP
jgi:hypothetical protein